MKEKIEILRSNAINAYNKTDENGKKLLKDLLGETTFNFNYKDVNSYEFACAVIGEEPVDFDELNEILENNGFDSLSAHEIAYRKLVTIAKALNLGWCPNWANFDEYKYYPWFDLKKEDTPAGVGSAHYGAELGVRFCTRTTLPRPRARPAGVPLLPKVEKSQSISASSLPKFGKITFCLQDNSLLTGCGLFLHP